MKFRTTKAALGWYAAKRKGPKMSAQKYGERIQSGHVVSESLHYQIASILADVSPIVRGRLLDWADKSDGAEDLTSLAARALRTVARDLRAVGIVDRPVRAVQTVARSFVDLNTGEVLSTKGEA